MVVTVGGFKIRRTDFHLMNTWRDMMIAYGRRGVGIISTRLLLVYVMTICLFLSAFNRTAPQLSSDVCYFTSHCIPYPCDTACYQGSDTLAGVGGGVNDTSFNHGYYLQTLCGYLQSASYNGTALDMGLLQDIQTPMFHA